MKIIGVDNGIAGAIALIATGKDTECPNRLLSYDIYDMPIIKDGEYDLNLISNYIRKDCPDYIFIEKAQVFYKQGSVSSFTTGNKWGQMVGVSAALVGSLRVCIVSPKEWQKAFGIVRPKGDDNYDTKLESVKVAEKLFPRCVYREMTKRGTERLKDGRADAILIANYGLTIKQNEKI